MAVSIFFRRVLTAVCAIGPMAVMAQSPFKGLEDLFIVPKGYVIHYVQTPPVIDGDINDAVWQQAQWTEDFVDIEGDRKPRPALKTNVKMLWGDSCLYIAAQIRDPHVWANITRHDDIIFRNNDFEVFVNPGNTTHQYFEMEFNALNTLFDLFLNKPYRNYGSPMFGWNANLHSAVKIQGTLNNPGDVDTGWTIEIALPYKAISLGNDVKVPYEGQLWRINFSRVEWDTRVENGKYIKLKDAAGNNLPEHNWVWSAQGVVNMHYPERWGYLQFTKGKNNQFALPYTEQQRQYLWLIYYRQQQWIKDHYAYSNDMKSLGINAKVTVVGKTNRLQLEATPHQFWASITDDESKYILTINQEGLIEQLNKNSNE